MSRTTRLIRLLLPVLAACLAISSTADAAQRWTPQQAQAWYARQPWLVGSNFVPADAINQLEMWQAATFDPQEIDRELGWAQGLGMTTMRVFLHDQLWAQDAPGFKARISTFLEIAARHGVRPVFVLFDSCWDPAPRMGPQHPPIPGVHNSGWVQGPSAAALDDPAQRPRLEAYVKDIVGAFGRDPRVLAWDVWNEPDNDGGGARKGNAPDKFDRVAELLPQVFDWARSQSPIQPLTSAVWHDEDWSPSGRLNAIERVQIDQSDVISFHNYDWPEAFERRVAQLKPYGRPIICSEYMARSEGSIVDTVLPDGKRLGVGMINWGFVNGRTQTDLPWDSWERPYVIRPPDVWFHDLLRPDGTPYRAREAQIIRELTGRAAAAPRPGG